ncbi:MAG: nuclear transport factor 2 family protein [Acidobacteriota bacterium]|nr:nuclear transport factor 2 family protein [Acidobacteriota bacterium]
MLKKSFTALALTILILAVAGHGQTTIIASARPTPATPQQPSTGKIKPATAPTTTPATTPATTPKSAPRVTGTTATRDVSGQEDTPPVAVEATGSKSRARRAGQTPRAGATANLAEKEVSAAFDLLVDGIRRANVEAVTGVYWNSPQLLLFNYNGTTTTSWDQVRANRTSSYPNIKDVKLDVRDVRVQMLGRDGALVTCLWSQSQTSNGATESSTGRLSLVFRRVGDSWKVIHTHTSPDNPDPSRMMPSERTNTTSTTAAPKPTTPVAPTTSPTPPTSATPPKP